MSAKTCLQQFQLETDTQVMRQFWRSFSDGKKTFESCLWASSTWSLVAKEFWVLLLIKRVWGKKDGCDCEAMHYSVSWESAATLRTHPCCFQSAQLCVGVLEMQVEHHDAEKLVLWLGFFLKFLQHQLCFSYMQLMTIFTIYKKKIMSFSACVTVRNAEIYRWSWQPCTTSVLLL